jgi:hypothetical protein
MTISNGNIISSADLNALYADLADLADENALKPVCLRLNVTFDNIIDTTVAPWITRDIVLNDDYLIHEVAICGGEHNGTVTITLDNGAMITPISMTGALGTGYQKLARYYSTTTNPQQVLLKGSTLTVTIGTTNTVATSNVQVSIMLLSWRRNQ